jgi:3-oxoadipate enol-lactonase/4-carboxymuconolactone decarboxylase
MLLRTAPEGYCGAAAAIADVNLTEATSKLRVPTLVIVGAHDEATPLASAQALQDATRGQLIVLDGGAHIPTIEIPDQVTLAVRAFLDPPSADFLNAGMSVRRQVLGEAHVARATAAATEFDLPFQQFITRTAWGGVWARPGLDRRTRSLVTLALLAGLGREEEFRLHIRATVNTGATPDDIAEAMLHVAVYAGVPAANSAMRIAKEILAERKGS